MPICNNAANPLDADFYVQSISFTIQPSQVQGLQSESIITPTAPVIVTNNATHHTIFNDTAINFQGLVCDDTSCLPWV